MNKFMKLTMAGLMTALCVVAAATAISIPVGAAKCFPVQHMVNVLAAVSLGPFYAVGMAFVTSCIRVATGTGTLNAFPGSMCGALASGLVYVVLSKSNLKMRTRLFMTLMGELFGTGIVGALAAYPVTTILIGVKVPLLYYVIPFGISALGGVIIAAVLLAALYKTGILQKFIDFGQIKRCRT